MSEASKRDRVFVSYSHLDSKWLDRVRAILNPDIRNHRIQYFDDRELEPGDPWYQEITDAIDHAKVAVLLVSPNFFRSKFIAEDELPRVLKAIDDGLTLLWVPVSGKFSGPEAIPGSKKLGERQAVWDVSQTLDSLTEESRRGKLLDLSRRINAHMVPRVPFNLPFGSLGDLFKGRADELRRLDEQLKMRGASAILQPRAITGLGVSARRVLRLSMRIGTGTSSRLFCLFPLTRALIWRPTLQDCAPMIRLWTWPNFDTRRSPSNMRPLCAGSARIQAGC